MLIILVILFSVNFISKSTFLFIFLTFFFFFYHFLTLFLFKLFPSLYILTYVLHHHLSLTLVTFISLYIIYFGFSAIIIYLDFFVNYVCSRYMIEIFQLFIAKSLQIVRLSLECEKK